MILVWLLAFIGLGLLVGLAASAVFSADRREPEDAFDLAVNAMSRLQAAAIQAVQELREFDKSEED